MSGHGEIELLGTVELSPSEAQRVNGGGYYDSKSSMLNPFNNSLIQQAFVTLMGFWYGTNNSLSGRIYY